MSNTRSSHPSTTPAKRYEAVQRALGASRIEEAIVLADEALDAGVRNPLFLNLSAFGLEKAGRLDDALTRLDEALKLDRTDVAVLTAVGQVLSQQGRDPEALQYFDAALDLNPRHAPAHQGRGVVLSASGDLTGARAEYETATRLDPRYPDPLGALADLDLTEGDKIGARNYADLALALDPDQAPANVVLASLDAGASPKASLARLERLLTTSLSRLHRAAAEHLRADLLETLDRPLESFEAYRQANGLVRDVYRKIYESPGSPETGKGFAERLLKTFDDASVQDWAPAGSAGGVVPKTTGHVFLVGFVRSGTTLLEQVLASHPDVVALEEQATLRAITGPYFLEPGGMERLAALGPDEADRLREDYWRRVKSFGVVPDGKVFVDKAPLATLLLPMVAKLFPEAKVLFAVRDPRDVVVSAFKHRLGVNALGWAFTDLVATAEFYAATMRLAARYREVLPLNLHQHRHEDLVADFDREVRAICEFLGLEWTQEMRNFAETAKRRDVRTPSAEQVRAGLSTAGVGRWRSYGPGVDPILPIVQPWVAHYGYD